MAILSLWFHLAAQHCWSPPHFFLCKPIYLSYIRAAQCEEKRLDLEVLPRLSHCIERNWSSQFSRITMLGDMLVGSNWFSGCAKCTCWVWEGVMEELSCSLKWCNWCDRSVNSILIPLHHIPISSFLRLCTWYTSYLLLWICMVSYNSTTEEYKLAKLSSQNIWDHAYLTYLRLDSNTNYMVHCSSTIWF